MPANYLFVCGACGHAQYRYRNVKRCRQCGAAALVRQEETMSETVDGLIKSLRELAEGAGVEFHQPDPEHWGWRLPPGDWIPAFVAEGGAVHNAITHLIEKGREDRAEVRALKQQLDAAIHSLDLERTHSAGLKYRAEQAEARHMILSAQLTAWDAQCATQVAAARALIDYIEPTPDAELLQLADRLAETITTDAGRILITKLTKLERQLLRYEGLTAAAAIVLHELGQGGVQEHTRKLLQSAVDTIEWGKKDLEAQS